MSGQSSILRLHAKRLRREETDAERNLWIHLRSRQMKGFKFRRQQPIGRYIVDFFCPEHRLVIELDGGHHSGQVEADQGRTAFLTKTGYRVLRFWDSDVLVNTDAVLQWIADAVNSPSPPPSPSKGRGSRKENLSPGRSEGVAKKTPHPHPLPQGARESKNATV